MVRDIWALGVNRLSIGVQSFDDDVLRTLGRAHSSDDARRAIEAARTRFENVSVDLMCGIPGQSAESFEASAREAVRLGATHVSVYPLTVEPHTPFDAAVLAGELEEPDDDVEAAHMQIAARVLDSGGFERYEVASYARPAFACRHNIAYWTGVPYLGLGRSAATMTQNAQRRMRVKDGQVTDDLDSRQMVAEDLMLGMRMTSTPPAPRSCCPRRRRCWPTWSGRGSSSTKAAAGGPPSAVGSAATSCTAPCSIWPTDTRAPCASPVEFLHNFRLLLALSAFGC